MWTWLVVVAMINSRIACTSAKETGKNLCRDRNGILLPLTEFKMSTCAMCYFYLIKDNPQFVPVRNCRETNNQTSCLMARTSRTCHCPSNDNSTEMEIIAKTINNPSLATRWQQCCKDAEECCKTQILSSSKFEGSLCPQTWDGWMCWNATTKSTTVQQQCPQFLAYLDYGNTNLAIKRCTSSGKWWIDNMTNQEKTDYSSCLPQEVIDRLKFHEDSTIVSLAFNAFGIALLIPAVIIFSIYRNLRHQNRIKLHIHLFISLLLSCISVMCWDVIIKYNRIVSVGNRSTLRKYQNACKILIMIEHYCRSTTYFWMLCEGFYLHRLLVKAFVPPKHLLVYYITGWGVPFIITVIYASIRLSLKDDSGCWIDPVSGRYHGLEWILFAPTILCIVLNLFFLLNILRILLRQLAHPMEPSSYRKAVKATFVLIPLLGIHQFFTIYRPLPDEDGYYFFTMAGAIIHNSQGIVISLIFCYFNGEVVSNIKASWYRRKKSLTTERKSLTSILTSRRASAISLGSNINRIPSGNSINSDPSHNTGENGVTLCIENALKTTCFTNGIINNGFLRNETTHL